ncbi:MAG: hypothetical protein WDW38_009520 [Sanguina aurantia]
MFGSPLLRQAACSNLSHSSKLSPTPPAHSLSHSTCSSSSYLARSLSSIPSLNHSVTHISSHRRRVAACCSPTPSAATPGPVPPPLGSVSVILLAGGVGKRMGASIPKQYIPLLGQPIAAYSLETFGNMPQVGEIVIVCDPSWRDIFLAVIPRLPTSLVITWALPGSERQDSVFNGLQAARPDASIVAVHDSARPLITAADAERCFADGYGIGAAVLGVPVKPTIKVVNGDLMVTQTLQRSKLWEVQTPQCIIPSLLRKGFELVRREGLEVTDDVSIIEALGLPVKLTQGSYTNIKVTTPDDLAIAEKFLEARKEPARVL